MTKELTVPEVIGRNVKQQRTDRGLAATEVGRLLGDVLGKVWARQTVYQVEGGDRSMIAEEVAAFAQVLDCAVTDLLVPPSDVEEVRIGALTVPAAEWRVLPAVRSADDLVSLRLRQAADDVKRSMQVSGALYRKLVREAQSLTPDTDEKGYAKETETTPDLEEQLATTICALREAEGLTYRELADRMQAVGCDIHQSAIQKTEKSGRRVPVHEVVGYARAFDMTVSELLELADQSLKDM